MSIKTAVLRLASSLDEKTIFPHVFVSDYQPFSHTIPSILSLPFHKSLRVHVQTDNNEQEVALSKESFLV